MEDNEIKVPETVINVPTALNVTDCSYKVLPIGSSQIEVKKTVTTP